MTQNIQIKIRAWDKDRKQMVTFISSISPVAHNLLNLSLPDYELMQFTGLLDKNGKEIYFGDILATSNSNPEFDIWSQEDFGLTVVLEKETEIGVRYSNWAIDTSNNTDTDSVYCTEFVSVIGNIYENPELLEPLNKTFNESITLQVKSLDEALEIIN